MATLSSLQDRIQGLGSRLKAENEAQSRERVNANLSLDFSRERPGSERRPRPAPFADFNIPGRPNTISARPRGERPKIEPLLFPQTKQSTDSPELNEHVREISGKKGIITIDGKAYKSTIEDMKYICELGNGTSGSVVKMRHEQSGRYIAVKQMHRSGNLEEAKRVFFDLEVVLKSHDCPYIVQCLGCFVTDTDVWICMELMSTCLDKLMKKFKQPFPEAIIGKIAVATVKALHYLKESIGVIHRDVKPSNILLDDQGNIKLCDFGISGRLVDSKAKTRSAGCAAYMAPERIDPPDPSKPDYDIRADVWSLGITLVELATGQFPYKDCKTDFEVLTKVLQDAPPLLPSERHFGQEFRDFVKDCLVKDYKQRPKYKRLLEYPFIKKYEKEKVDVIKWFAEVSRTIEDRSTTWPQSIFPTHFPRPSRSSSRAPSSLPVSETPPTPPPVAPRRRSRTRSQERLRQLQEQKNACSSSSVLKSSLATQPPGSNGNLGSHNRPKVPLSPSLGRTVPSSVRNILPASPSSSRALSASPVMRPMPSTCSSYSSTSSHPFHALHTGGGIPHHQYGVPNSSQSTHNCPPKHNTQMYSQYCNPYSLSVSSRVPHSLVQNSQPSNSGNYSSSLGEHLYSSNVSSSRHQIGDISSGFTNKTGSPNVTTSFYGSSSSSSTFSVPSATSSTSSSSSSCSGSQTPQILRKTPEPVRFNPEPWAPRGRFTQPAHNHFRSLSHDFSTSSPRSSLSRHPSYLPPHVSPLVSRRIVESRAAGVAAAERTLGHGGQLSSSSVAAASGPCSLPSTFSTPHYRYTQEAYYNSRPYYTPEPQRRVFLRLGGNP